MENDASFVDAITAMLPARWVVRRSRRGPWLGAHRRGRRPRATGWKLHVSATPASSPKVLARALPVVIAEEAPFKVAASPSVVEALNEGVGGLSQVGKFMTVYPRNNGQALRLAEALDRATRDLRGPRVASDQSLHRESLVSYRFSGRWRRKPRDPFVAAGIAKPEARRPIAGRYVIVSPLHRSAGGSVDLAADIEDGRVCVIKRAGRDARVGPDGRDAMDWLAHEAELLRRLGPDDRVPAVYAVIEEPRDLYVVFQHVPGRTLGSIVTAPCGLDQTLSYGRRLARLLCWLHESGIVYRDLNPLNVMVDQGGTVRLVDFELACNVGETGIAAGTPGYCSPEQLVGTPASRAQDVYGLGALLHFMAAARDPGIEEGRVPEELRRVIARCLKTEPKERYASMNEVDAELAQLAER